MAIGFALLYSVFTNVANSAAAQGNPIRWFVVTYTEQGRPMFDGPHVSLQVCEVRREDLRLNAIGARDGADAMLRAAMREQGEAASALRAGQRTVPRLPSSHMDALLSTQAFARLIVEERAQEFNARRSAAERAEQSAICQLF